MSQEDEVPAKKKKSKAKLIFLILLLLVLGGGGYFAYTMGFLDKFFSKETTSSAGGTDGSGAVGSGSTHIRTPTSTLKTATFDPFVVNLADQSGNHYISLTLDVEVISPEVIKELEVQNPRIRDAMIRLLSNKTSAEIKTPVGKRILTNEILDRMNQLLGGPKITQVYFQNFVVQ